MKLVEAIVFATEHQEFLNFLNQHNIRLDSAHEVRGKISDNTDNFVEHYIFIDYGNTGPSPRDVRVIVRYNIRTRDFTFEQIDLPI